MGALCLRSPNTCRPVRDTVYANFCREYLSTCGDTQDPPLAESAPARLPCCVPAPAPPPAPPACPAAGQKGGRGAQLVHESGQLELFQLC